MAPLTGQFFFLTLAGLALSMAGFAGLVGAFRQGDTWTKTTVWRLRNIVRLAFIAMFLCLAPVVLYTLSGDEAFAIRATALACVGAALYEIASVVRERAQWSSRGWIPIYVTITTAELILHGYNVAAGSVGVLMIQLVVRIEHPAHLFYRVIASFRPPLAGE